ncbi:MAG: cupin domain-containing protein [Flavobacteriales bacterium]|nr:cupin domain-containing protein [Flavobacteriales bacterium]MCB9198577.1 cupin domain-containing protein [Flavobacteriales bacterium]
MNSEIDKIVSRLGLVSHPEGGYYKETYRSSQIIGANCLDGFSGDRNYCTSIYFLLTSDNFSAFHRIKQDEIWHFYQGSPLYVHVIYPDGNYVRHQVGMNLDGGQEPQLTVPAGCWFASSVKNKNDYSFVGCTVAPGFDFEDFELATYSDLSEIYPQHRDLIKSLTRI